MTSRKLTQGEIALAQRIFKDSIDYSKVVVHSGKYTALQSSEHVMTPNGEIYYPNAKEYRPDFSVAGKPEQALFIHEMVHVWQYQNDVLKPLMAGFVAWLTNLFDYSAAYKYTLDESKDLLDYNLEQQAAIIEDYFWVTVLGGRPSPHNLQNKLPKARLRTAYNRVLLKFIANPNYANDALSCIKQARSATRPSIVCK